MYRFYSALMFMFLLPLVGCDQNAAMNSDASVAQSKELTPDDVLAALKRKAEAGDKQAALDVYINYFNKANSEQIKKWINVLLVNETWLLERATNGDGNSQFALGMVMIKKEQEEYSKAKSTSHTPEKNEKAIVISKERNYEMDDIWNEAIEETGGAGLPDNAGNEWFVKAASKEQPQAAFIVASHLLGNKAGSVEKAIELLQKSADSGYVKAQILLGDTYASGDKVARDRGKALEWYLKAAEQGSKRAQITVGNIYSKGEGVPQDDAKAFGWFQKAAAQGYAVGQSKLGNAYLRGIGVTPDLVYAYAWFNLAAAQGLARDARNAVAARLTAEQRAEGQRLASDWKQGDVLLGESVTQARQPSQNRLLTKRSNGTAFAVSIDGYALTNFHVVKGCDEMRIAGRTDSVSVKTTDSVNDLALLQIASEFAEPAPLIADPSKLRQGADVIVFGYPLNSVLSSGGNLTPGTVSALTGLGNNTNQIQITAPIQPGSSGSPVLDRKGSVVGVVSMKLDDIKSARATGSIPQNVNFAVNGQTVKTFLDANKVKYKTAGGLLAFDKSNADIAESISKSTVLVECWK